MKKIMLLLFACFCIPGALFARKDLYSSNLITGTQLASGSAIQLSTSVMNGIPSVVSGVIQYKNKSLNSYAQFFLNTNNIPAGAPAFTATIKLNITYYLDMPNPAVAYTETRTLTINYNPLAGAQYKNTDLALVENAYKFEATVVPGSFMVSGMPPALNLDFISLQLFTGHERFFNYQGVFQNPAPNAHTLPIIPTYDPVNNELTLTWANPFFTGEGYELEYTFVDDYSDLSSTSYIDPHQLYFSFRNNSTKILLPTNQYKMPIVHEHGWLLFRYIGYGYAGPDLDRIFYSPYPASMGGSNPDQTFNVFSYPFKFHVNNLTHTGDKINWQSVTSFAEEGKTKTVVKYMDGIYKQRQMVTATSTEKNAIIAETIYDFQGRPAVNILPAPVEGAFLKYYSNFNQNLAGQPYSYKDFDIKGTVLCAENNIGALNQQTTFNNKGAGNYYSKYNPDKTGFNAWIPEASGYALNVTQYLPDPTGTVVRQGGVGETFQPGNTTNALYQNHDTKTYLGKPNQRELDALFGSNAGYAQFYQKNLVVDANGQASVSYINLEGKTIATALAGDVPPNLDQLTNYHADTIQVDLLAGTDVVDRNTHSITNSQVLLVTASQTDYHFSYAIKEDTCHTLNCTAKNYCLDCIYDLEITLVKDDCAKTEYHLKKTIGTLNNLNFTCNDANAADSFGFNIRLNLGSYTITKTLTVNKNAAAYYADSILNDPGNTCLKTYEDFYEEAWNNRDTSRCKEACESCIDESKQAENAAAITEAERVCDSLWCNPDDATICEMAKLSMISDLTPGGQYAKYRDEQGNITQTSSSISIFYPYAGQGIKTLYNTAAIQNIMVTLPGEAPMPLSHYLSPLDTLMKLINNWPEELSEELLPLHPEYCYLQFCNLPFMDSSAAFATQCINTNTYANAQNAGLLSRPDIDRFYTQDPLYGNLPAALQTDMVARFTQYGGTGASIKQLAVFFANCPSGSNINTCNGAWGDGVNDDEEWERFRNLYFSIRQEFEQKAREYYVQHTAGCCVNAYIGCKDGNCNIPFVWGWGNIQTYLPCFPPTTPLWVVSQLYKDASKRFVTINDMAFGSLPAKSYYEMTPDELSANLEGAGKKGLCPSCPELDGFKIMLFNLQEKKWFHNGATVNADAIGGLKNELRQRFTGTQNNTNITIARNGNQLTITSNNNNCRISFTADTAIDWEKAEILPTCLEIQDYRHAQLHIMVNESYKTVLRFTSTCDLFYCEGKPPAEPEGDDGCHCDSVYRNNKAYKPGDVVKYKDICYVVQKVNNANGLLTPGYHPGNKEFWEKLCGNTEPKCTAPFNLDFETNETFDTDLTPWVDTFKWSRYVIEKTSLAGLLNTNHFIGIEPEKGKLILGKRSPVLPNRDYRISLSITAGMATQENIVQVLMKINNNDYRTIDLVNNRQLLNYTCVWNSGNNTEAKVDLINLYNDPHDHVIEIDSFKMECLGVTGGIDKNGDPLSSSRRYIPANACGCDGLCNIDLPAPDLPVISCDSIQKEIAGEQAREAYNDYRDSVYQAMLTGYYEKCMQRLETFTVNYKKAEYHYTLYYYDQSGNLVKTVPPAGVQLLPQTAIAAVTTTRNNNLNTVVEPAHFMVSQYNHNSLNAVLRQKTPDAGESNFAYDKLGRLAVSVNARQKTAGKASYTLFDKQGRTLETGEMSVPNFPFTLLKSRAFNFNTWQLFVNTRPRAEITRTWYDEAAKPRISNAFGSAGQKNLRNRIATVALFDTITELNTFMADADLLSIQYSHATHYQYDIAGNVTEILQDFGKYTPFGFDPGNVKRQSKHIAYSFDLVSGKVNGLQYQQGFPDQFFYRYRYNADNKLTHVYTSSNNILWEQDAAYTYYKHGPVAKMVLGADSVQGVDYAYALQGWIKGVNGLANTPQTDMGKDGNTTPNSPANTGYNLQHQRIAPDIYGYWLGYYKNDYQPIGGSNNTINQVTQPLTTGAYYNNPAELFNGNIGSMYTWLKPFGGMGMQYRYDQLNRLLEEKAYEYTANGFAPAANNAYYMALQYDANGNIQKLLRNGAAAMPGMDNLNYIYYNNDGSYYNGNPATVKATNRLAFVTDVPALSGNYTDDVDIQAPGNYGYDAIGNLTRDIKEGITSIHWNLQNKISRVRKRSGIQIGYGYDPLGNRVWKIVQNRNRISKMEFIVRDAQGNTLAVYTKNTDSTFIKEQQLYGSSRLGVQQQEVYITGNYFPINQPALINNPITHQPLPPRPYKTEGWRNTKTFELTNHLGNVLATISDGKTAVAGSNAMANISSATDYYAFGMGMPSRTLSVSTDGYRYGMNGQEKSNEIFKHSFSAEFWEYDSRIAKRWNVDPKLNEYEGSYVVFGANPIWNIDLCGDKWKNTFDEKQAKKVEEGMTEKKKEYDNEYESLSKKINEYKGEKSSQEYTDLVSARQEARNGAGNMERGIREIQEMGTTEEAVFTFKYQYAEIHPEVSVSKIREGEYKGKLLYTINYKWGDFANRAHETQHGYDLFKGSFQPVWKNGETETTKFYMTGDHQFSLEKRAYQRQYFYDKNSLKFVNINKESDITRDLLRTLHPNYKF